MKFMLPAEYVIYAFGGIRKAARAIGRNQASVWAWTKPVSQKGKAGQVPDKAMALILKAAEKQGIDITAEDLVVGRTVQL